MIEQILFGDCSLNYECIEKLRGKVIDKISLSEDEVIITFQDDTFSAFGSEEGTWKSFELHLPYGLIRMGACTDKEWNDSWAAHVDKERAANIAARRQLYETLKKEFDDGEK